jgi:hypothetical protein
MVNAAALLARPYCSEPSSVLLQRSTSLPTTSLPTGEGRGSIRSRFSSDERLRSPGPDPVLTDHLSARPRPNRGIELPAIFFDDPNRCLVAGIAGDSNSGDPQCGRPRHRQSQQARAAATGRGAYVVPNVTTLVLQLFCQPMAKPAASHHASVGHQPELRSGNSSLRHHGFMLVRGDSPKKAGEILRSRRVSRLAMDSEVRRHVEELSAKFF